MRVPWVALGFLAVLLALCLPTVGALGEGGIDPRLPHDLYPQDLPRPQVEMTNGSFEEGGVYPLSVTIRLLNHDSAVDMRVDLRIYRWGMFGSERELEELSGPLPTFVEHDANASDDPQRSWSGNTTVPTGADGVTLEPQVDAPPGGVRGYYRVRVTLLWTEGDGSKVAMSMGHFTEAEWRQNLDRVRDGTDPVGADFLVSEGGFSLVPEHFNAVSQPNKVPDFSDFTTPVIRPGETGKYNFTVTNRYDAPMTDVVVTIEFYMWATIEDAKPIEKIEGTPPKVRGEGGPSYASSGFDLAVGEMMGIDIVITTSGDTDKGTYFVRHSISFTYEGVDFTISSRGFYTWDQWEGFDYSNLYYQLDGSAGIVPDSSFSVKDPVPLWPLATLIALCVLFGALAVVFYLAEEHGDQYPRLKRGLQLLTGRWEQRKRLMQQRMDELRGEDREAKDAGSEGDGQEGRA